MEFFSLCEFRGVTSKKDSKGKVYNFINLEDTNGEGCQFICSDETFSKISESHVTKGDVKNFIFEYNQKYGSLKLTGVDYDE